MPQPKRNTFFVILILGLLSAIGPFSIDMYLPGFPDIALNPELVLVGILPPLLYVAALQTSVPAFRRQIRVAKSAKDAIVPPKKPS